MTDNSSILPPVARHVLPYLALTAAVFAAYANVYDNVLLFDDNLLITLNEYLHSWSTFGHLFTASTTEGAHIAGGFYRPVQNILYFFIYQIDGLEPPLYHLLNVSLHAANACLVFLLGRKLGFNSAAVFLAALIWALHPLHTEVIAYVSGTAEPLFTLFCLLGLIALLPDFSPRRILKAIPFFILGLLSKENAVSFPALAIICLYLVDKNRLNPRTYLRTWPLWLIVAIYVIWRMTAPGFEGPQLYSQDYEQHGFDNLKLYAAHFSYRLFTFFATLPAYLRLLIWPTGLHMERGFPVYTTPLSLQVWEGIAICTAAAGQIIWGRGKRGLPFSWGLLWFAAAHFPNSGLALPVNSQFLEHWMYLPSIGLFLGTAESLRAFLERGRWRQAEKVAAALAVIVAGILALRTAEQNEVWHDPFTFYGNIFKYGEVSPRGTNNLAIAYMGIGDYPNALVQFQKAIDQSDTYAETRYNQALAFLGLPNGDAHVQDAIASLKRSLEIDPNFYRSWSMLAVIYDHLGDHAKAEECRKKEKEITRGLNLGT